MSMHIQQNVGDYLMSSKILKTGDTRPMTLY